MRPRQNVYVTHRRKKSNIDSKCQNFDQSKHKQCIEHIKSKKVISIESSISQPRPKYSLNQSNLKYSAKKDNCKMLRELFKQKQISKLVTLKPQIPERSGYKYLNNTQAKYFSEQQRPKTRLEQFPVRFLSVTHQKGNRIVSSQLRSSKQRSNTQLKSDKMRPNIRCKLLLPKNSPFPFSNEAAGRKQRLKMEEIEPFDIDISRIEDNQCPQAPKFISKQSYQEVLLI